MLLSYKQHVKIRKQHHIEFDANLYSNLSTEFVDVRTNSLILKMWTVCGICSSMSLQLALVRNYVHDARWLARVASVSQYYDAQYCYIYYCYKQLVPLLTVYQLITLLYVWKGDILLLWYRTHSWQREELLIVTDSERRWHAGNPFISLHSPVSIQNV